MRRQVGAAVQALSRELLLAFRLCGQRHVLVATAPSAWCLPCRTYIVFFGANASLLGRECTRRYRSVGMVSTMPNVHCVFRRQRRECLLGPRALLSDAHVRK